jgi:2,3-bisphosphoglycerate-independent phosphoglycerate mutase
LDKEISHKEDERTFHEEVIHTHSSFHSFKIFSKARFKKGGRENRTMIVLVVLDGWGISTKKKGNAIALANTPHMDYLTQNFSFTTLASYGEAVGLPDNQMGNSEVGHLNIGAGRIVYQDFTRINKAIRDKSFFQNSVFLSALRNTKEKTSSLHLFGLVSDGGVHSHMSHLFALLRMAKKEKVGSVFIHAILDGRDTPPRSAKLYLSQLEEFMGERKVGAIATVSGRYYSMDRDRRWERTKKAYDAMVFHDGYATKSATQAVEDAYARGENDEFVSPTIVSGKVVESGDSVVCFNFRPDRVRQMTHAFLDREFPYFKRNPLDIYYVCMTEYEKDIKAPIAFPPRYLMNTLGEVIAKHDMRQLRIAETEKYAHVTFFFNGGDERRFAGEDRILIPSPKVATYDLKPEMSAYEVTERVIREIESGKYGFVLLNYANPDMVGHTGILEAARKAIETVDECMGKVYEAVSRAGGTLIVTSDHGNAEMMVDGEGRIHTAHTTNRVPLIIVSERKYTLAKGKLGDISPSILDILGWEKPQEMTGISLIK